MGFSRIHEAPMLYSIYLKVGTVKQLSVYARPHELLSSKQFGFLRPQSCLANRWSAKVHRNFWAPAAPVA